jgi:phosphate uptake regulator
MKRKVIQLAGKTFVVSLPLNWVKKYRVNKGDEITVEENSNSILLKLDPHATNYEGSFNFSNYPVFLVDKMIARIYEMGYDKVTIQYSGIEQLKKIESRMPELMGFEIIESGKNSITIQDISSNSSLDFDNILRKAFFVLQNMLDTLANDIKNKDLDDMNNIIQEDLKVNKYTYFCLRQLNKNTIGNNEVYVLFYLTKSLEDLGDIIKRFVADYKNIKKPDKKIHELIVKITQLFRLASEFFYTPKVNAVVESLQLKDKIFEEIKDASKTMEKEFVPVLMHMTEMTRKIYHFPTLRLHTLVENTPK